MASKSSSSSSISRRQATSLPRTLRIPLLVSALPYPRPLSAIARSSSIRSIGGISSNNSTTIATTVIRTISLYASHYQYHRRLRLPNTAEMASNSSNSNSNKTGSSMKNRLSKFFSSSGGGGGTASTSNSAAPATKSSTSTSSKPPAVPGKDTKKEPVVDPTTGVTSAPAATASKGDAIAGGGGGGGALPTATAPANHVGPDYTPAAQTFIGVKPALRTQYPTIEPYATGTLKVEEESEGGHEIYWELSGKKGGHPVVFLHGGPGGGCSGGDRRWFDPEHYQILTFDQRGSGRSIPSAELKNNTTWHLVSDIERLRTEVAKVEKWHVFGGSWGSTLALAYAQKHPDRVSALILRGIFTLRRSELEFFYQDGAGHLWPEQFQPFLDHIPASERTDLISAYYNRVTSSDYATRLAAARIWSTWENSTSRLYLTPSHVAKGADDKWVLEFARIESHYFHHGGWMQDGQLLTPENVAKIAHIPTVVVQGRYDVVCPAKTAYELANLWTTTITSNNSSSEKGTEAETDTTKPSNKRDFEFFLVPDAGHSAMEPGIADRLLYATDKFRAIK